MLRYAAKPDKRREQFFHRPTTGAKSGRITDIFEWCRLQDSNL